MLPKIRSVVIRLRRAHILKCTQRYIWGKCSHFLLALSSNDNEIAAEREAFNRTGVVTRELEREVTHRKLRQMPSYLPGAVIKTNAGRGTSTGIMLAIVALLLSYNVMTDVPSRSHEMTQSHLRHSVDSSIN